MQRIFHACMGGLPNFKRRKLLALTDEDRSSLHYSAFEPASESLFLQRIQSVMKNSKNSIPALPFTSHI